MRLKTLTAQHLYMDMSQAFRRRQLREWGNRALSVACLFRCHLCCTFKGLLKSQHPARACFSRHPSPTPPSRTLRAFSDITQMSPDGRPRLKSHITNNTASGAGGGKKRGFRSKSSRRRCLLIQNSVSVSQSVLSKIPTLS